MAVDVGCGRGYIAKNVYEDMVGLLYQCDMAENVLVSYCPAYREPFLNQLARVILVHN